MSEKEIKEVERKKAWRDEVRELVDKLLVKYNAGNRTTQEKSRG